MDTIMDISVYIIICFAVLIVEGVLIVHNHKIRKLTEKVDNIEKQHKRSMDDGK